MKISYEYEIQKMAYVPSEKGELVAVGVFEHAGRDENICKMTVKLFPSVPKELIEILKENPQVLVMKEVKNKASTVVMLPEGHDEKLSIIIP